LNRDCPDDQQRRWSLIKDLCSVYTMLDRAPDALAVLQEAIARTTAPEILLRYAYWMSMLYARYLPERDLAEAERWLNRSEAEIARSSLSEDERLFQAVFNQNGLALIRYRQGRAAEARELCRQGYELLSTRLAPSQHRLFRSALLHNVARTYVSLGATEAALPFYGEAIALDPHYSEYYNERGNLLQRLGRYDAALHDYRMAVETSPPYPEVHGNLGLCYLKLGRPAEAAAAFTTCLELAPADKAALLGRAEALEALDRESEAVRDYTAALALDPGLPGAYAARAALHYAAGRLPEALADLNAAIALDPENPDLYYNRAAALGGSPEAMRDLETYLRLRPDADDRAEVEARLGAVRGCWL
ncbi:MAG TPA: tetratricopeptide repeat protein, partial [Symbiobacteriaceae bacterium]|nr:tetratricopeptide repeat protein [Symbiobacteriaceae bacterium]